MIRIIPKTQLYFNTHFTEIVLDSIIQYKNNEYIEYDENLFYYNVKKYDSKDKIPCTLDKDDSIIYTTKNYLYLERQILISEDVDEYLLSFRLITSSNLEIIRNSLSPLKNIDSTLHIVFPKEMEALSLYYVKLDERFERLFNQRLHVENNSIVLLFTKKEKNTILLAVGKVSDIFNVDKDYISVLEQTDNEWFSMKFRKNLYPFSVKGNYEYSTDIGLQYIPYFDFCENI